MLHVRTMSLGQRSKPQSALKFCAFQNRARPLTSPCMLGFEDYLALMIITARQCVMCKNHVARSKVTVGIYNLCIGFSETCLCPAHNVIVAHASGMV